MRLARVIALAIPVPFALIFACSSSSTDKGNPSGIDASFDSPNIPPGPETDGGLEDADAAPPPPSAGGTGAFGIVTINGKQKMYLPLDETTAAGNGIVAVVDVGIAGNGVNGAPALVTDIDLGVTERASATGGDPSVVIAASISSKKIWFIDPATDTLTKTIELDATFGPSSFSGGGGYVTGIAVDSPHHRAILSVWNGFAIVDLQTKEITKVIQSAPSENFGFDSVHNRILAPFYDCTNAIGGDGGAPSSCGNYKTTDGGLPITDGLNVIDLNDDTVYTYQDPAAATPEAPVGREPDSASVDPSTGVVAVPSEGDGYTTIIDLSKATFDKTTKTVTAPHHQAAVGYEGIAIEPSKHYAFWEAEFSSDVGVGDLTALNAADGPAVLATMPNTPADGGGGSWSNLGDPHGIAVTAAITDGKAVGFVVSSDRRWVARVDLAKLLATKPDAGNGTLTTLDTAPSVTFLDARNK